MSSKRRYTTIAEVQEFADITSTNDEEFEDRITQCEELIDAYVGFQPKFISMEIIGNVTGVSGLTITDSSYSTKLGMTDNYLAGCYIEIIGGSGVGNRRYIVSSSYDGRSVTYEGDDIGADATSVFRIFQLGKFPRQKDCWLNSNNDTWYKIIPENVKRAVAAQMEFIVNMGDEFLSTNNLDYSSETIGNYSYSRGSSSDSQTSAVKILAPKAKALLKGYKNSLGQTSSDNPTWL